MPAMGRFSGEPSAGPRETNGGSGGGGGPRSVHVIPRAPTKHSAVEIELKQVLSPSTAFEVLGQHLLLHVFCCSHVASTCARVCMPHSSVPHRGDGQARSKPEEAGKGHGGARQGFAECSTAEAVRRGAAKGVLAENLPKHPSPPAEQFSPSSSAYIHTYRLYVCKLDNLKKIKQSINFEYIDEWIIVYDGYYIKDCYDNNKSKHVYIDQDVCYCNFYKKYVFKEI